MKRTNIHLPDPQLMRLEVWCNPRDIVRAAYIRRAIYEKLDRDEKAEEKRRLKTKEKK